MMQHFLIFIKENKFEYETESEKLFSKAMRKTSEENFKDNIDLSYKQLMADINKAKEEMLVAKKEEIVTFLLLLLLILISWGTRDTLPDTPSKNSPR